MNKFNIKYREEPLVVAELSGNHNQSLSKALELVDLASEAGVDAVKLQTYTPDTMTLDLKENEFKINNPENLWSGYSLYELYHKSFTPWEWHEPIFKRCEQLGMYAFSSPFDNSSVEFLESLDVPCYKIASFENIDIPLIKKVAQTGKPLIISSGMATVAELWEAVEVASKNGCEDITILKCTTSYPARAEDSNIRTIPHMKDLFQNCNIGLSDHTLGIGVAVASVALGAKVIEKHLKLPGDREGVDSAFSLDPIEMRDLVTEVKRAWSSLGTISYGATIKEEQAKKRRRSLYISRDVVEGEEITEDNVKSIRPGLGLPPKYKSVVMGRTFKSDYKKGTPLSWDLI
ncbi:pseudaminic acid synthase [Halobacillus litoralis]|uniref:pseudaminic acid synthase n=1 Tax=Halobacillus litoralis TaxID=45668 RepID=UPI001CD6AF46|nr:pseudaminic acid synthase [Halobacillus litoralis]MCA0971587.1 pseudaminic acid synthase [Halobacillus litoralis]